MTNKIDEAIDTSAWPLMIITLPAGNIPDDEVVSLLNKYTQIIKEKVEPYALVMDVSKTAKLNLKQRKMLVDQMKANKEFTEKYCKGNALVFKSALLQGILTAMFWIFKPKYETKIFTQVPDAIAWAQSKL
jgi:hypothetical protein